VPGDHKRSGPPATKGPQQVPPGTKGSLPDREDDRPRARTRLADEHRRLGICRLADEAMPLTVYYSRPLRTIPLGQFLVERWWGAA
jgi:hypothetical protein